MAKLFGAPTFTWPFRVAIFTPVAPFIVILMWLGILAIWGESAPERLIELTLGVFWMICAAAAIAEVIAVPTAARLLLLDQGARTSLNVLSFIGGAIAVVFLAIIGWFFLLSKHAI